MTNLLNFVAVVCSQTPALSQVLRLTILGGASVQVTGLHCCWLFQASAFSIVHYFFIQRALDSTGLKTITACHRTLQIQYRIQHYGLL